MSQNKATLRKKVISAMANKDAANDVLEAIQTLQATLNALLLKMDGDTGIADTDYVLDLSVDELELD